MSSTHQAPKFGVSDHLLLELAIVNLSVTMATQWLELLQERTFYRLDP